VELMTISPQGDRMASADVQAADSEQAGRIMADFLSFAMPEVLKCLPDWKAVNAANATK
jgi:hypothetical protein